MSPFIPAGYIGNMGQIISSIHTAWIAAGIVARHTDDRLPQGITHLLENTMVDTLSTSPSSRIYVHWGAYESGKSRASRNAKARLQMEGKLVMLFQGWEFTYMTSAREWVRTWMGVPKDRARDELSMFLPADKQTVLIIDHADVLLKRYNEKDLAEALRELNIPTLLLFGSWERAVDMLKQEGCKLLGEPGLGRWHWQDLAKLYYSFPEDIRKQAESRKDELHQCALLSGSPGILQFETYRCGDSGAPSIHRAELINTEWENGIRALKGENMQGVTGKFPDKDLRFRWEHHACSRQNVG
jgi:hypothetical protein